VMAEQRDVQTWHFDVDITVHEGGSVSVVVQDERDMIFDLARVSFYEVQAKMVEWIRMRMAVTMGHHGKEKSDGGA
jgi:hypothetical protein